jgi:hypothetical protein
MLNENFHYGDQTENNIIQANILNLPNINMPNLKIKLDDILEGIKIMKQTYNVPEELRVAIKILKRMKMNECLKWNSEILTSYHGISFNQISNICLDKTKNESTPYRHDTNNITLKNLNLIFNKPENFNFSSILINSERESFNTNLNTNLEGPEYNTKSPENFIPYSDNHKYEETSNKKFTLPSNKFLNYYKKLKHEEYGIQDILNYAGSLFELKEFGKCAYVLRLYAQPKYQTAMFLYYYCDYMLINQRQQEELIENSDLGSKHYSTSEMNKLFHQLSPFEERNELGPFMLYLFSLILKSLNMNERAKTVLVKCINAFPFLWSAWIELATITKVNDIVC